VTRLGGAGPEEFFYEEVEGSFPETSGVPISGGEAYFEFPSPVSPMILDKPHSVRNLDVPSLASVFS
jgi:hypothetical protein